MLLGFEHALAKRHVGFSSQYVVLAVNGYQNKQNVNNASHGTDIYDSGKAGSDSCGGREECAALNPCELYAVRFLASKITASSAAILLSSVSR